MSEAKQRKRTKIVVKQEEQDVPKRNRNPNKSKLRERKPKATEEPVPESLVVEVEEKVEGDLHKKRKTVSREELESQFKSFISVLESELQLAREQKSGVKKWRDLIKQAKQLKTTSIKTMKKPKRVVNTSNSGFMKPVNISREMAQFAGWDESELKSRNDVTNYLCKYIQSHDLQNPNDRRQILADDKLRALIKYNEKDEQPLTYYYLQKKIQQHFPKAQ